MDAQYLKTRLDSTTVAGNIYFTESVLAFQAGSDSSPLWLKGADNSNSDVTKYYIPESNMFNGVFKFCWDPNSTVREGDFYLCYTWTPINGSDKISDYIKFNLLSDLSNEVANPSNIADPKKYEILLKTYTPNMYNLNYAEIDDSVYVLEKLNKSIAQGFTAIENMALQLQDIMDANATQEPLLIYLADLFKLTLRSNDPTLWRRQIKTSIPRFKRKGTLLGIKQALSEAGIRLLNIETLWLCGSEYVWTESFEYIDSNTFELSKISLAINSQYFSIYRRTATSSYALQSLSDITIQNISGISILTWNGKQLEAGDHLRITYQIKPFENQQKIDLSNYITNDLQLADTRDDRNFKYPSKDWNTHVVSDLDPLFNQIVTQKNPFYNDIKFGKVRTIFPYSENIYNMDEYNGSLRDSTLPCDIDKTFTEPCRNTISSYYNTDVEIENLSTFRMQECLDIIEEYMPYHAISSSISFQSTLQDFVLPPEETIQMYISFNAYDFMIAGMTQYPFNRSIRDGLSTSKVLRNQLATETTYATGVATFYNDYVNLFCPNINFYSVAVDFTPSKTFLEIINGVYAGNYRVTNPDRNYLKIVGNVTEPLNPANFSFRLSNILLPDAPFLITKHNNYTLSELSTDVDKNYQKYDIKSIFDVDQGLAVDPWKIQILSTNLIYDIQNISNNVITIKDTGTLSNSDATNLNYRLLDSSLNVVFTSTTGDYKVEKLGKVNVPLSPGATQISPYIDYNTYFYVSSSGAQHRFAGFIQGDPEGFLISNWTNPNAIYIGKVLSRTVDNQTGNLCYYGMKVLKPASWPTFDDRATAIIDAENFKENYLLYANNTVFYFTSDAVDSNNCLTIAGNFDSFTTLNSTGTSLAYELKHYDKNDFTFSGIKLYDISRSGQEVIVYLQSAISNLLTPPVPILFPLTGEASEEMTAQSTEPKSNKDGIADSIVQSEGISITIENINGETKTGDLL